MGSTSDNLLCSLLVIQFLNYWQHSRKSLQTVETVVRTQTHRLDADKFPTFSVGWNWQEFCRDLDPC